MTQDTSVAGFVRNLNLKPNSVILLEGDYYQVESVSAIGIRAYQVLDGGEFAEEPTMISLDARVLYFPHFRVEAKIKN